MASYLPGYQVQPLNFSNKDGILFSPMDDLSVFLSMNSTTEITYNSPLTVTTSPVMSGANVADNFSRQPKRLDISGVVVTEYHGMFLLSKDNSSVEDFISTVETWRDQKRLIRVICKDGITLDNCVINDFSGKKDKTISNGLYVSMSFTQIDIVKEATQTTLQGVKASNVNGSKSGSSNSATTSTKAVESKKIAGKASTTETESTLSCKALLGQSAEWLDKHQNAQTARNKCQQSVSRGAKHGEYSYGYTPSEEVMSDVRNSLKSQGVNQNLQEGSH